MISTETKQNGLNGGNLKTIALFCMTIDHFAVAIVYSALNLWRQYPNFYQLMALTYDFMRLIGRIAFPIYVYLINEGFKYSKNRLKYALRLLMLALISEVPFDMILNHKVYSIDSQNVFFTLLIGLLVLILIEKAETIQKKALSDLAIILIGSLGFIAASGLRTDYGAIGVMTIVVIYLADREKNICILVLNFIALLLTMINAIFADTLNITILVEYAGVIVLSTIILTWVLKKVRLSNKKKMSLAALELTFSNPLEITSLISVLIIGKYNGARGKFNKWLFYFYYPAHLLVLALLMILWGIY